MDMLANNASGNTVTSSTKANLLTLWQHGNHTEFMQLQYAYGKSGGKVDTDKAFAHLRHRTAISGDWAVEGFAQTGRNLFARLTQRTLPGGGMRRIMFEEETGLRVIWTRGRSMKRRSSPTRWAPATRGRKICGGPPPNLVLKSQISEQVRVYSTTYYQPAFSDTADYRILEQASMLVKLREDLDFKVSLDISFDSLPAQTVQKRDLTYSTGLAFRF